MKVTPELKRLVLGNLDSKRDWDIRLNRSAEVEVIVGAPSRPRDHVGWTLSHGRSRSIVQHHMLGTYAVSEYW